ncbi:CHASE domain-containing protein [Deinococcus soli (ex Cha et al. 2016)]|uniref:CHASE domain-containing protein n=1 Tax=Deinococcus soli (ex Cha et al. 2016) TaxID=1309411 RepID=UPI0019ABA7F9|nr:CHASE domain-containing protein [Deinococcus soli (ex Cha et al. 2016)]GGB57045.1 histidine kinase [Deinococcus soli (ex Cha et al. 2016)]
MRRLRALPLGGRQVPALVMLVIVLLSLLIAYAVHSFAREQQRGRFEREAGAFTQALQDRVLVYERLLEATRSSWQTVGPSATEAQFAQYVGGLDLTQRYPGVQAVGFGQRVARGQAAALLAELRRSVSPDLRLRTGGEVQEERVIIARIAPPTAVNLAALGFDLNSEPLRRAAMREALVTGRAQATAPLRLVQRAPDGAPLAGFLVMLPVQEAAGLGGFMYVAVDAAAFLRGLEPADGVSGNLNVRVQLAGQPLGGGTALEDGLFTTRSSFSLIGQTWTLEYSAGGTFGRDQAAFVPYLIALLGLLLAGFAFRIVKAQVDARGRAERLNVSLGHARSLQEAARAEFEAIFQSMQDAAVFTDAEGRVRLVNRALRDWLGRNDLEGRPLGVIHADRRLDGRSRFEPLSTSYVRADGTVFSGEAQRSEVLAPDGTLLGLLEVVRDIRERVQAEQAVQAEERRSRAVLDALPSVVQLSGRSGRVRYRNLAHQEQLGGVDLAEHLNPAERTAFAQWREQVLASGRDASSEWELSTPQGARWFQVRVNPVRDPGGPDGQVVSAWVTTATDIHDRLLAERRAQRNEERYRAVLEGMPQIVWLTDPRGAAVYFNRRWAEFVGEARAAQPLSSLIHPEDRADYLRGWQAALASGRPFEAEHRLLRADGQYRAFVTRGLPVLDGDGLVMEWVGTSTDVDDQVYAEQTARLLADVSEQLSARSDDPSHLRHDRYRAALARLDGRFVDSGALWTVHPTQLVAASSPSATWHSAAFQVVAGGAIERVVGSEDPVFIDADPALHRVSATGALFYPLTGRDGTLSGVLGLLYRQALTARDQDLAQELAGRFASALTNDRLQERVLAAQADLQALNQSLEERVQQRTLELESANRELEAFSYSVSHDLRTPLRHIVGFGDLLARETGDSLTPKGQRYLTVIKDSASRMSQLIDDLLSFSRMGRQEMRQVPVDLRRVIESSWQGLEPDRAGRRVTLSLPDTLPTVQGDESLLGLVFTNLLSNAIKYSRGREEARVTVSVQAGEHEVTVNVSDNGLGFDPRYVDKLFGVFQRLHRAEEFEGIGIGLANVRRIVTRHGGRVSAEGRPGEGATFSVTLPLRGPA